MVDGVGPHAEDDGKHVIERATTCVRLGVDGCDTGLSFGVKFLDEDSRLVIQDISVVIDSPCVQTTSSNAAVLPPNLWLSH